MRTETLTPNVECNAVFTNQLAAVDSEPLVLHLQCFNKSNRPNLYRPNLSRCIL
jgi:hypothetical protein